ncbi:MAG: MFS transporter [Dysgonamonadaceae bacterium]|nr:MFS transporter [Dysgonamonadaceae bacterium]
MVKQEKMTNYRWMICAMLFFATTVNYLDRQVLSLTWPGFIGPEFGWTNVHYGNITAWFSILYAVSMLFAGRLVDWLDTKKGFLWAIGIWSFGACLHAFCGIATAGVTSGTWTLSFEGAKNLIQTVGDTGKVINISVMFFIFSRFVLALGEAGNFPAAIKATAEYFPKKDRAFSTSIFNSGATIGAMVAPVCILYIAEAWGWESSFLIIGVLGFIWMGFWVFVYKKPEVHPKVNKLELAYIQQDKDSDNSAGDSTEKAQIKKLSFLDCFKFKQTWAFAFGKFMTDGVWWFYLFWMPKYLQTVFKLEGTAQVLPLTILYTVVMLSIIGGWLPSYFVGRKGMNPYDGRMKAMLIFAFFPLLALFAQPLGNYSYWLPVVIIGIAGAAHQAWSANIFSTVGDMFPKTAIATVTGIGGMAGGVGSFIIQKGAGKLFDHAGSKGMEFMGFKGEPAGYFIVFIICAVAYLIGWVVMKSLVPKYKVITV